jgi:hypothetical protein
MFKSDVLFILKKRELFSNNLEDWNCTYSSTNSSGLYNSVLFVNNMLQQNHIDSHMVEVIDNNCIDRVVTKYRPRVVIIEALWVVPEKFDILKKLHPKVQWMCRLHSEIPFLAVEGIAIDWLKKYVQRNVVILTNSKRLVSALDDILPNHLIYAPNYYQFTPMPKVCKPETDEMHISSFGAIRPLKNQLIQAIASMKVANYNKKKLKFYVNSSRKEQNGEPVLRNLEALFSGTLHELVKVPWLNHDDFLQVINNKIEIGLQISFTETYNIVACDHINCNVPIITSPEIVFVPAFYHADPHDVDDIAKKIQRVYIFNWAGQLLNKSSLEKSNKESSKQWKQFLNLYLKEDDHHGHRSLLWWSRQK